MIEPKCCGRAVMYHCGEGTLQYHGRRGDGVMRGDTVGYGPLFVSQSRLWPEHPNQTFCPRSRAERKPIHFLRGLPGQEGVKPRAKTPAMSPETLKLRVRPGVTPSVLVPSSWSCPDVLYRGAILEASSALCAPGVGNNFLDRWDYPFQECDFS